MPENNPNAELYAEALVTLGRAAGALDVLEKDMAAAVSLVAGQEQVRRFLADPTVQPEGKRRALDELLTDSVHPALRHFLLILAECNALHALDAVAESFYARVSQFDSKTTGELVTAHPLSADRVAAIERETGRVLGRDVHLRVTVATGLLAGLKVKVGDFVFDGTVDAQLDDWRRRLQA